ncbi:hypothetical protein CHS0354_021132 [Potamilus streckersoni]|uniref:Uncharacterized protein n=1 Tax=Potamilus streckersoni TaxID=2493646 RepID=A0AAE0W5P4_9BIVA|nr:hypothetical protein CHS0354_021132 [Potamilus streckersoni]
MADGDIDLHPTRAKLLFALIIATTVAQIAGFFSRTWACKEETLAGVKKCDMQGLFYLCTNRGCYGTVINQGIFGLAFIAFVLDLGIGGYICYRMLINGDSIAWIWHHKHSKRILSAVYIISLAFFNAIPAEDSNSA